MERLAATLLLPGFSADGSEEGIRAQPPVFELSAAEVAGRPGRRCDTIISV